MYGFQKKTVYDALLNDITKGKYKPYDIITESSLVMRFEVSKAPIREALVELCKDNVLKSIPRTGYQVVPCTLGEIIDILDFRIDLETSNLKRAFDHITSESLTQFDAIFAEAESVDDAVSATYYGNNDFHLALCSLSGNAFTYKILAGVLKQSSRFFYQYYQYAWENITEPHGGYHVQIIEALKKRDIDNAVMALVTDINSVRNQLKKYIPV